MDAFSCNGGKKCLPSKYLWVVVNENWYNILEIEWWEGKESSPNIAQQRKTLRKTMAMKLSNDQ